MRRAPTKFINITIINVEEEGSVAGFLSSDTKY